MEIKKNVPLAPLTTFKIGGPAKFFCEVKNREELEEAIRYAKDKKLAAFVMGGGSNILFSDNGFDGLVIKMISSSPIAKPVVKMRMENGGFFLECWAGELLASIATLAKESALAGMEWATGIPGTIGGAVRGNAGTPSGTISENINKIEVLDLRDLKIDTYNLAECEFQYRQSVFKRNDNLAIVSVELILKKGEADLIENKMKEVLQKRNAKQPQGLSPGSYFENPVVKNLKIIEDFEKDTGVKAIEGRVPAGWLIESAGLLGKKIGAVKVSEEHGNFVINMGGARAQDVIMLASIIKQKIRTEFDVELIEEIKYVGF